VPTQTPAYICTALLQALARKTHGTTALNHLSELTDILAKEGNVAALIAEGEEARNLTEVIQGVNTLLNDLLLIFGAIRED
jgi:hypothetical protein